MPKFVLHDANNQFLDNFNNGGGQLSSVLLFKMIFTFKRWLEAEAYLCHRRALLINYFVYFSKPSHVKFIKKILSHVFCLSVLQISYHTSE